MQTSKHFVALCSFVWLLLRVGSACAQPEHPSEEKTLSPYFFIEGGDAALDQLPLKDTRVEVAVSGVIADVTVRQVYENQGKRPIHARYVFPASTRAAVYGMTMTIGDARIVAKVAERDKAKQEFEKAKSEGKTASLLEQSRPNVFAMAVSNILPRDTVTVELKYTELLVPTGGTYEFVYPTVVGPRYSSQKAENAPPQDQFVSAPYLHQGESPRSDFHLAAKLSTGVPVHDISSPSHRTVTTTVTASQADIALDPKERFSGNRDFILRYRLSGTAVDSGLLLFQGKDENFFLLTAQPPTKVSPELVPPREYIFVLDVSGSMNGFPLDAAKKVMRDLFQVIKPTDTFNVVLFADGSKTFAPSSVPATSENVARAISFIGPQRSGGGTELLAAMKKALELPRRAEVSRSVVLVTDGYIDAEKETFNYIRDHLDKANVFAFGIGSSVNRYLIEGVARAGQGEPFIVTRPEESTAAASRFREYIETPVLTGIDVHFSGFDTYDVEPSKIPDLFASRPVVVFGKWRGQPAGSIEVTGHTGREPYRSSFAVASAPPQDHHRALRYLWARTRIANLSDYGPEDPAHVAQVTSLGLNYSLLTPYTSFIAVREIVRNPAGNALGVEQPLPLPLGVSDSAVGGGVDSGDEPELLWIACAVALVALGFSFVTRRRSMIMAVGS